MATPIWRTSENLGSVKYGVYFEKVFLASNTYKYELISGQLPVGITLSDNGILSGEPLVDNPTSNTDNFIFTFTVRAVGTTGILVDKVFRLSVIYNDYFIPTNLDQTSVRYSSNNIQYQILRGNVDTSVNRVWRLSSGIMPPNSTISPNGLIEIFTTGDAIPLIRESFLNSAELIQPGGIGQESWDNWLRSYLYRAQEFDYQFGIELSDPTGIVDLYLTVRVIYTKIPSQGTWFQDNQVQYNPNQYYFFFAISDDDHIQWETLPDLGSINNGSICDLSINAQTDTNKDLYYIVKPGYNSKLPLALVLFSNGIVAGRVSFRTFIDDPENFPAGDNYNFAVRASTLDGFTYGERVFSIHVNRFHERPYDNLWVRAFAPVEERLQFRRIMVNQNYFPDDIIYRPADPWFGKAKSLRFLFSPGLLPENSSEYYQALANNHYDKTVTFGEVKTAVAYDENMNIKYEVVYLPIVDNLQGTDPETRQPKSLPDNIDLRGQIVNYYLLGDQTYFTFTPNGLENMRNQLDQYVGFYEKAVLPEWMTSPQPIPGAIGQFYVPTGFIPAMVLAYTKPGGSDLIAFRLRRDAVNFNEFVFEFDRYEFERELSADWNDDTYSAPQETVFDNNTTIFEGGGTRFIEGLDSFLGEFPALFGDKYLKFPKNGVFV